MSDAIKSLDGNHVIWKPQPKQELAMVCPARELLFGGSKASAKPLAFNTIVPTPTGWSTQGTLRPGDYVIGADGKPALVLGNSGLMEDRKCYRLTFSDRTEIICDSEHPWSTLTNEDRIAIEHRSEEWRAVRRARRPSRGKGKRPDLAETNRAMVHVLLGKPTAKVRTTEEIVGSLYVGNRKARTANHSIANHPPVEFPEANLPVPPYTLGAWLGDGTSAHGSITCADPQILERICADGFTISDRPHDPLDFGIIGLKPRLRTAGVLGRKHIPNAYLRASIPQRLELLRGLMDTDGWVNKTGSCHFSGTNKILVDGVAELVRSLGVTVRQSARWFTCTNSATRAKSLVYGLTFVSGVGVFHLDRKKQKQNLNPHPRYGRRFIVKAEQVDSVPVCCIKTTAPGGLYLAGHQWITTHNTDYLVASVLPILTLAHEKFLATGRPQHRCRMIVFRKNLEDLKDFLAKSYDIYPYFDPQMGTAGYSKHEKTWTFTSGASLTMRHLDDPTAHLGYNGHEFVAMLFDEVQQIPYEAYSFLTWQVRSKDHDYHRLRMIRCTANPGGHDWVATHFNLDECPEGGKIHTVQVTNSDGSVHETTRVFIRARTRDNKYLPPDYEAQMRSTMTEDEIAMYIDGDFRRVAGAFFSKLLRPSYHFIKSRPIPDSWPMRFAMDWGSTNPAALYVGALDNDGCLWVIDELHQPGVTGRTFGENMRRFWERQKWCSSKKFRHDEFYGVIDKQAMDKYGSEQTAAAGIMEWGFRLFPANKDRIAGCNQLKERMLLDRHGKPQMVIFEDRCPTLCRSLSKINSNAPENPEEYDPKSTFAHAADGLRFLCMEFPVHNARDENPIDAEVAKWNEMLAKRRRMAADGEPPRMTTGYD